MGAHQTVSESFLEMYANAADRSMSIAEAGCWEGNCWVWLGECWLRDMVEGDEELLTVARG